MDFECLLCLPYTKYIFYIIDFKYILHKLKQLPSNYIFTIIALQIVSIYAQRMFSGCYAHAPRLRAGYCIGSNAFIATPSSSHHLHGMLVQMAQITKRWSVLTQFYTELIEFLMPSRRERKFLCQHVSNMVVLIQYVQTLPCWTLGVSGVNKLCILTYTYTFNIMRTTHNNAHWHWL